MRTTKLRIWSEKELTIAYYIAKWDFNGLGVSEEDVVELIIGETTIPSLKMQIANFRFLLNIEGYQLKDVSKAMKDLADKLKDKTMSQVRKIVLEIIDEQSEIIEKAQISRNNKLANSRRDVLNQQEVLDHENKLKSWKNDPRLSRLVRVQNN